MNTPLPRLVREFIAMTSFASADAPNSRRRPNSGSGEWKPGRIDRFLVDLSKALAAMVRSNPRSVAKVIAMPQAMPVLGG